MSGVDRLQESLDGIVYDLQVVCEQVALAEALAEFREWLTDGANGAHSDWSMVEAFDAIFGAVPLAQRADVVAQRLIAQAADERRGGVSG